MAIFNKLRQVVGKVRGRGQPPSADDAGGAASRAPQRPAPAAETSIESRGEMREERVPEITPQEVWQQLEEGEPVVFLDIRMPWDHQSMHPKGAEPLPITEIQARLDELDKEQHYVLSCYHGYSSQDAAAFLLQQGFKDVKSMSGGFSGWAAAGLPVEGKFR